MSTGHASAHLTVFDFQIMKQGFPMISQMFGPYTSKLRALIALPSVLALAACGTLPTTTGGTTPIVVPSITDITGIVSQVISRVRDACHFQADFTTVEAIVRTFGLNVPGIVDQAITAVCGGVGQLKASRGRGGPVLVRGVPLRGHFVR